MVRGKEEVAFQDGVSEPSLTEEDTKLFNLVKKSEKYYVRPVNDNQPNDRLWLVIRSIKDGYVIKRHDILKLGRMKFKVKEFRTESEYFEGEHKETSPHKGFEEIHEVREPDSEDVMCRFCWIGDQTEENPIIGSCRCDGSIKYIHFNCLKLWLDSQVSKKNDTDCHSTLNWKKFECELCKLSYPYTFMFKGKRWNLVDLKRPTDKDTPYIILESLNSEKNSSRTIHTVVINTDRNVFSLGRGHDSDLRINDISVSRKHANIEYKDGKFYFVDLKSKFGTLALLSHDIELMESNSHTFQIGRTVVTLKAKQTQPWKNKEQPSSKGAIEEILKDKAGKDKFLFNSKALVSNSNSGTMAPLKLDQAVEGDGKHQIIEIDGKRYLVIQELPPDDQELYYNEEVDDEED